jgi:uncharacterized protein YdaU (DUF1376 family)
MSKTLEIDISQFILDTMGFDSVAVGAYVRLLVAYRHAGPIANDERALAKLAGLDEVDWDMRCIQIGELFEIKDGLWVHPQIDEQAAKKERLRTNALGASKIAARNKGASPSGKAPVSKTDTAGSSPAAPAIDHLSVLKDQAQVNATRQTMLGSLDDTPRVATEIVQVGKPADDVGTHVSPDWMPTSAWIRQARSDGFTSDEIAPLVDSFKGYHNAAGTLSTDWNGSWDRWWDRKKPEKKKVKPRVEVSRKAPAPTPEDADAED